MKEVKVALFGIEGYAHNYTRAMENPARENVRLVGAVDPYQESCPLCPLYKTGEELYARHSPDLVVIGTPIHLHEEQVISAFAHGCHVLVEKPLAATMESAKRILAARDKAGKQLSVGFQLCSDETMLKVRADALSGVFGAPVSLKALVLWPRDYSYFNRTSGWAGRKFSKDGKPIYDSVLNNAAAHYIMNILYVLNEPLRHLACRTYRANCIETYDTAVVKGQTQSGANVFVAVSHAVKADEMQNPIFEYEYENATVSFGSVGADGQTVKAVFKDGTVKEYGELWKERMSGYWNAIDALRGEKALICTGEIALMHVDAIEKMRALEPEATVFPEAWIRRTETRTYVEGLAEQLIQCYERAELPAWNMNSECIGK